ncbi:hypothetical protein KY290_000677 [Solanum tuberosum]|uniref:Replication factor A C-terminal domain-containing protein n=1 Tax=Solanum tuberosum TaxID=4113 RepID=A0ABQ7WM24_SOLTU|nr:hypothetical protein KY289_000740 [Solanum tuberosum]KAH0781079.1 hypothetical protein KY290_000677 [Solanum tuberosum]
MAAMTDYISEINSKLMYWKLKVRIVRLWENTDRDRPDCPFSIEVILMDEKGDRIHASLGRSLFPNFRESIKEMGLYFIKNFVVCPNTMKLRIKDHKFKLMFTKKTVVEEIEDPHFDQISVKNTWHASKLYINSSLPQVDEFSSRIKFVPGESSQRLTQISSQRNQSIATELASGSVTVHEIEKLIDCRHQENYYIVAKIIHLEIDRGWSFLACKQCAKGVDEVGDKLYCRQCGFVESVIRRYKLKIRVWDDTGTISVMLWDGVATKMIEKSATDLFESSDGQGQDEVFKVVTFTDDEDIIEKYRPPPRGETFKDPDFNDNQVSLDDREFMDSTEDTKLINVSQTPNKIKKIDAATVVEEDPNSQLSGNKIKRVFKKKKIT